MPPRVHADTRKDANDDFNIYLNSLLSADMQAEAYWHEIEHIRRGHFYQTERPVAELEAEARQHNEDGETKEDKIREMAHKGYYWP